VKPAFLDTNIIIRYLTNDDLAKKQACYALLKQAEENKISLTTSEAVITEVVYVLASKRHYYLSPEEIRDRLHPVLSIRGLRLAHRQTYLRALELYVVYRVDFEDCLSFAHMEGQRLTEIYSYDQDFDQVASIKRIEPQG
jgi:predicted nucleic acid-binding protein